MNKERIALIIVAILLIVAVCYIGYATYKGKQFNTMNTIYQEGALYGYQSAIAQIIQTAQNCNPVSVYMNQTGENVSMSLVDVACLQQTA